MEDLTDIPDQEIVMASDNGMEEDSFQEEDFIMDNLTWTGNDTFYFPLYEPSTGVIVLLSVLYVVISLVAVLGNSTVIFIVCTSRRMQSVTNYFIANLALADVIIGLFSIPFNFQAALLQSWNHLPDFLCPFSPFFQNLSVNASIFTLTAIAVDRYRAIMWPLKSHSSKSRTKVTILIIWVVATLLAVPLAVAFRAEEIEEGLKQCRPEMKWMEMNFTLSITETIVWEYEVNMLLWYRNLMCMIQYFIPCILIGGAYTRMAATLWSSKTPGAAQLERDIAVMNNKKKVIKMLMVVVALFTLAWLPLQLYDVLNQIFPEINYYQYINMIWFCCHMLAMSNSCYNPFIYLLCNEKFKKELRLKLKCCFGEVDRRPSMDYSNTVWKSNRTIKKVHQNMLKQYNNHQDECMSQTCTTELMSRSRGSSISPSPSYQSRNGDLLQTNQENNHKQYETNLKPYNIPPPPFNTEIQNSEL